MAKFKKRFKYRYPVTKKECNVGTRTEQWRKACDRIDAYEKKLRETFNIPLFPKPKTIASFSSKDLYHSIYEERYLGPGETLEGTFGKPKHGVEAKCFLYDYGPKGKLSNYHRSFIYYRYMIRYEAVETNIEREGYIDLELETWNRSKALNIFNKFKKMRKGYTPECCRYAGQTWWEWGDLVDPRGKPFLYESGWG